VSFLIIGIVWINHHAVMELIARVDRGLAFLNLLLLMAIALIPFTTALFSEYLTEGDPSHAAAAAYSIVITLMGAAFGALWLYASREGGLLVPSFPREDLPRVTRRFVIGTPVYGLTIVVAFLSAPACLVMHAALAVYYAVARRGGGMAAPAAVER
jgi:uncharacterized membrane protein